MAKRGRKIKEAVKGDSPEHYTASGDMIEVTAPLNMSPGEASEAVAIVAMGGTRHGFLNQCGSYGNERFKGEVWACNATAIMLDPYFIDKIWLMDDLHETWLSEENKNILRSKNKPIITSTKYDDFPTSVEYPLVDLMVEIGMVCIPTTTTAYALVSAIQQRIKKIYLHGTDFKFPAIPKELQAHIDGLGAELNVEGCSAVTFWCGLAAGMGLQIILPPTSDLLGAQTFAQNPRFYGYRKDFDTMGTLKEIQKRIADKRKK